MPMTNDEMLEASWKLRDLAQKRTIKTKRRQETMECNFCGVEGVPLYKVTLTTDRDVLIDMELVCAECLSDVTMDSLSIHCQ